MEGLNEVLPEGLPMGMVKEFEESMRSAVLVRQSFLDLRDNFRRVVDPSLPSPPGITFILLYFLLGGGDLGNGSHVIYLDRRRLVTEAGDWALERLNL